MENRLYSVLEALDIWPKNPAGEQSVPDRVDHCKATKSKKKCDHQCVDCFLLFCQEPA